MDLFACFLPNALEANFYTAITAPHFDKLLMGVIGIQCVFVRLGRAYDGLCSPAQSLV